MGKKIFNKWSISVAVFLIIGIIGYFVYRSNQTSAPQYLTATATKESITVSVSASGNVSPQKIQNAGFLEAGRISEIDVKVGDTIKAGQQLAIIDPTLLKSQFTQSQIAVDEAENNLQNRYLTGKPTAYDIANLQESINQAQIKVNTDQSNLNNAALTSPKNGIISAINLAVGDNVNGVSQGGAITITNSDGSNPQSITFSIPGKVSEIDVTTGQAVAQGQIIAKLDTTQLQNQLVSDQSSLNIANNNLQNKNISNNPTKYDIANLKDTITSAKAKLASDQVNLDNTILRSNIDGVIAGINSSIGDNVPGTGSNSNTSTSNNASSSSSSQGSSSSSAVMTIIDPNSLTVNLQIDEADIAKVNTGQPVQLSFSALGNKTFVGSVESVDATSTTSSNVVYYGVKVSINKIDPGIRPGMSADATIISQTKDDIITVPNGAIKTQSGQATVQILKNNKVETVNVTTGISDDTNTEITNGINEGDTVITGSKITNTTIPSGNTGSAGRGGFGGASRFGL